MVERFMTICPRTAEYTGYNITGIPLRIIKDDGIEYTPHISFSGVNLDNGAKFIHNNSGKADSFSITVLLNANDTVRGEYEEEEPMQYGMNMGMYGWYGGGRRIHTKEFNVIELLDYYIRKGEPFYVTTKAVGINSNDLWLITSNSSRYQATTEGYVEWKLSFTKKVSYTQASFKNDNAGVTQAYKNYQKRLAKNKAAAKKAAKKKALAKLKSTPQWKLEHNCKYKELVYSKTKKTNACVKVMQTILVNQGCFNPNKKSQIDGWYGKQTVDAVKRFQKKYAKKFNLKKTGKVDKATYKVLYWV